MQNITFSRKTWATMANRLGAVMVSASMAGAALVTGMVPANAVPQPTADLPAALPDGVYLYGQSTQPDEIGSGYFVFESKKGQVVGALYLPKSSFDCAAGSFKADQLALTVTNSYDRITNPLEIALDRSATVASQGNVAPGINLQGFHRLDKVTENDLRMLNVCKADLEGQAKTAAK